MYLNEETIPKTDDKLATVLTDLRAISSISYLRCDVINEELLNSYEGRLDFAFLNHNDRIRCMIIPAGRSNDSMKFGVQLSFFKSTPNFFDESVKSLQAKALNFEDLIKIINTMISQLDLAIAEEPDNRIQLPIVKGYMARTEYFNIATDYLPDDMHQFVQNQEQRLIDLKAKLVQHLETIKSLQAQESHSISPRTQPDSPIFKQKNFETESPTEDHTQVAAFTH